MGTVHIIKTNKRKMYAEDSCSDPVSMKRKPYNGNASSPHVVISSTHSPRQHARPFEQGYSSSHSVESGEWNTVEAHHMS